MTAPSMMTIAGISGHTRSREALERMAASGRMHGFLIAGHRAAPTRELARAFAAALLGCAVDALSLQPTFTCVACPIDEKTGEKKKTIPVGAAEALIAQLALSGVGDKPKVALIEDADALNDHAQNALLKTVEEPAGRTVLIFVADDATRLLPTLRSRLVTLTLTPTADEIAASLAGAVADAEAFLRAPRSQRLVTASIMTKGDEASSGDALHAFVEAVAYCVHTTFYEKCATMTSEECRAYGDALAQLADMPRLLRENANATLTLERLALLAP